MRAPYSPRTPSPPAVRANLATVGIGDVFLRNDPGQVHVVVDLDGWFGP